LLAWLLLALPVKLLATSQQEWRERTAAQIARDRGLAKSATQLREVMNIVANAPIRARLFDAQGSTTVDDQLQTELRAALLHSGVEPTNFKVLPGSSSDGLRQYRVEFASIMSVDQFRGLCDYLARQPHYVRIERLRVDAPPTQRTDENARLTLLMEVQGFALDTGSDAGRRLARAN
jgi:hypothetical protein